MATYAVYSMEAQLFSKLLFFRILFKKQYVTGFHYHNQSPSKFTVYFYLSVDNTNAIVKIIGVMHCHHGMTLSPFSYNITFLFRIWRAV